MRKLIKKHNDGNLLEKTKDIRQRLLEYARKKKEELRNFSQEQSQKIQENVNKVNENNPPKEDNRFKPTIPTYVIRGIKKKYAENGTKFTR